MKHFLKYVKPNVIQMSGIVLDQCNGRLKIEIKKSEIIALNTKSDQRALALAENIFHSKKSFVIMAKLSGRIHQNKIKVIIGDKVLLFMSTQGDISSSMGILYFRYKNPSESILNNFQ